ncbi:type VII secretion-associated serine protease mycosin [Speluncibacter jeojiensis]|uniref:type VII secretion-associated serine protease mycosin n=1 Tax=Speluncibacter jeojiensis TaxID=2710754 RepID=UPI00240EC07A|nr:type VII secretion-associated serine protease mycosin [Rhodococcus sp. D2-41]
MITSRLLAAVCVSGTVALAGAPPAFAANPPPPGMRQTSACTVAVAAPGSNFHDPSPAQRFMDFQPAWKFATGRDQRVAVIDTGVSRNPRLHSLEGGGDFIGGSDGTSDCDGHGTAVAGLIAGASSQSDGFAGVAPDATIIAIRQSSSNFSKDGGGQPGGDVNTLAAAVRKAIAERATVINISEVACRVQGQLGDGNLGAAVREAADQNIVVVAAAGNTGNGQDCPANNPLLPDPLHPDASGEDSVQVEATPARFSGDVLAVGSVDADGTPSKFTLSGPWIGVAAPGEGIVSLATGSGLADSFRRADGQLSPIEGTSFAAPYVAGVAALVRQRYPKLNARQVIERIERTAHSPAHGWDSQVGFGIVDPVAAVTADLPSGEGASAPMSQAIPAPAPEQSKSTVARDAALIGVAVCVVLLIAGSLASLPLRRIRRR